MNDAISIAANAKINLYLDITGRRADGYHLLETVMQSVDLCDIVTVSLAKSGISAFCTNPDIPQNEKNICHKAAKLFFEQTKSAQGAEIRIDKRIPDGAGLGGGSADAAAVLFALNTLSGLPLRDYEISELAAKVGADVPFCLVGGTRVCSKDNNKLEEKLRNADDLFSEALTAYENEQYKECADKINTAHKIYLAEENTEKISICLTFMGLTKYLCDTDTYKSSLLLLEDARFLAQEVTGENAWGITPAEG